MRLARLVAGWATAAVVMTFATASVATVPPSTEPPSTEPPSEPATTTSTAPTTTTAPTSTTSTSTATAVVVDAPSSPITAAVTVGCFAGQELIEVDVTALEVAPSVGVELFYTEIIAPPDAPQLSADDFGGLQAGESLRVVWTVGPGAYQVRIHVADDISVSGEIRRFPPLSPFDVVVEQTCPASPTAPTLTATVERCAADESGGAIAVTMMNPPGGPEYDLQFSLEFDVPTEGGEWSYSLGPADWAVADGEQATVIVEHVELWETRPLPAGDYQIAYGWSIDVPGGTSPWGTYVSGGTVELTLPPCEAGVTRAVRVATFNTSLTRAGEGELVADLSTGDDRQAAAVAEILQRVRPDVVLLNEFDYDEDHEAVELFRTNYLAVGRGGAEPIEYPYWFLAPVNTGVQSGFDLDRDGTIGGPGDALGFGEFPGQHGMVVLSRYPILTDEARTFQDLLWASMPGARLPDDPATLEVADWYSAEELAVLPLSSTSHWDVPVDVEGVVVHVLASHPTPPNADGDEDPSGPRNADEIGFWAEYVAGDDSSWIVDDAGVGGGLADEAPFVIVGDLNADPADGDSVPGAIQQPLDLDQVLDPMPSSDGAVEAAEVQGGVNAVHEGDPRLDTADLADDPGPGNLRLDYVLPSDRFDVVDAGVYWPPTDDPQSPLVGGDPATSSDHRLVWVDLVPVDDPPPAQG